MPKHSEKTIKRYVIKSNVPSENRGVLDMSYSGVEHKLRIFISSKCGGKYTIARKALKKLLEATGLVEVYAFETEPASSEDNQ